MNTLQAIYWFFIDRRYSIAEVIAVTMIFLLVKDTDWDVVVGLVMYFLFTLVIKRLRKEL